MSLKTRRAEYWRLIPNFQHYAASSWGRIAHVRYNRELVPFYATDDRRAVRLYTRGSFVTKYVHQCVAMAFLKGYRWGMPVSHLNGDNWDNHLINLRVGDMALPVYTEPEWHFEED